MKRYTISADSEASQLVPVAFCLHEILGRLPVTARSKERKGVRIEEGRMIDLAYTGPVLEEVLEMNRLIKKTPVEGPYRGVPVVVAPIRDDTGEAMGAIGVVDITGIFDLATLMEHHASILQQVCGKDPCPLPAEQVAAKR